MEEVKDDPRLQAEATAWFVGPLSEKGGWSRSRLTGGLLVPFLVMVNWRRLSQP